MLPISTAQQQISNEVPKRIYKRTYTLVTENKSLEAKVVLLETQKNDIQQMSALTIKKSKVCSKKQTKIFR